MGIPTVGAAASNIVHYAIGYNFEYTNGMPIRYVGFPFPVAGQPKSVHHSYVFERNDTVSGKPMMQAIIDNFTKPLTDKEKYKGRPEAVVEPRLLKPDTEDNLQQLFKDKDLDRLQSDHSSNGRKSGSHAEGNQPEAGPGRGSSAGRAGIATDCRKSRGLCGHGGRQTETVPLDSCGCHSVPFGNSTSSMANMILVNGPIRNESEVNYKGNVMGPHNEVNSVLGRCYTLLSKTAGNLHAGKTTFSSLGSNMQYNNLCIAETEEALPAGLKPTHVQMGVKPPHSIVSVGTGWSYISSVGEVQRRIRRNS